MQTSGHRSGLSLHHHKDQFWCKLREDQSPDQVGYSSILNKQNTSNRCALEVLNAEQAQRDEADLDSLDRTLERLIAINPDDVEVLQEHTILISGSEDERFNRNIRRLEALGIDFQLPDKNIPNIAERWESDEILEKMLKMA